MTLVNKLFEQLQDQQQQAEIAGLDERRKQREAEQQKREAEQQERELEREEKRKEREIRQLELKLKEQELKQVIKKHKKSGEISVRDMKNKGGTKQNN